MPKKSRKYNSPEEKIVLLRRHLVEEVPVSQICEEQGLQVSLFYGWLKQLFERGAVVFEPSDRQQARQAASKDRTIERYRLAPQRRREFGEAGRLPAPRSGHKHVAAILRRVNVGRRATTETRAKMSQASPANLLTPSAPGRSMTLEWIMQYKF